MACQSPREDYTPERQLGRGPRRPEALSLSMARELTKKKSARTKSGYSSLGLTQTHLAKANEQS
jgi:hypothetical protein